MLLKDAVRDAARRGTAWGRRAGLRMRAWLVRLDRATRSESNDGTTSLPAGAYVEHNDFYTPHPSAPMSDEEIERG